LSAYKRNTEPARQSLRSARNIPSSLHRFFWEYDPGKLDVDRHADLIMARLMERGSWQAMVWLRKTYPAAKIARFLEKKGWRVLAPREINYWALVCDLPENRKTELLHKSRQRDTIWSRRHEH